MTVDKMVEYLGEPYCASVIDGERVVYRKLNEDFDFEVSGVHQGKKLYSLYVWRLRPHREIVGVYHNIHGAEVLKDFLGYCAIKYGNRLSSIQAEREEP